MYPGRCHSAPALAQHEVTRNTTLCCLQRDPDPSSSRGRTRSSASPGASALHCRSASSWSCRAGVGAGQLSPFGYHFHALVKVRVVPALQKLVEIVDSLRQRIDLVIIRPAGKLCQLWQENFQPLCFLWKKNSPVRCKHHRSRHSIFLRKLWFDRLQQLTSFVGWLVFL